MNVAESQIQFFQDRGWLLVPRLFSRNEAEFYRDHFMAMRSAGTYPGDSAGVDVGSADPLKRFPRLIHMHRWDEVSLRWMIDPRINAVLTAVLGIEPLAVQTMLYFKPPGSRGQALHQDQFYLRVQPGTCAAAWMALDPSDEDNGCLQVVEGTHNLPILCTESADVTKSFTDVTVPVPGGRNARSILMQPGDVFFFNGSIIHGSCPNTTKDRFRRALIGHYISGHAERVAEYYHPILRMDGTSVELGISPGGGPCGVWTDQNGRTVVAMREAVPARP